MLNKLKISSRLVLLIAVQTLVLLAIGFTAIVGLHFAANTTVTLNENIIEQVKLNQLNETVIRSMADHFRRAWSDFDSGTFVALASGEVEAL